MTYLIQLPEVIEGDLPIMCFHLSDKARNLSKLCTNWHIMHHVFSYIQWCQSHVSFFRNSEATQGKKTRGSQYEQWCTVPCNFFRNSEVTWREQNMKNEKITMHTQIWGISQDTAQILGSYHFYREGGRLFVTVDHQFFSGPPWPTRKNTQITIAPSVDKGWIVIWTNVGRR